MANFVYGAVILTKHQRMKHRNLYGGMRIHQNHELCYCKEVQVWASASLLAVNVL